MVKIFESETEGCAQDTVRMFNWNLPDTEVDISIPEGLQKMKQERAASYFPMEERPEIIWEDEEEKVIFTIQLTEQRLRADEIMEALKQTARMMKKSFPAYAQTPIYMTVEGRVPMGWFLMHMDNQKAEHYRGVLSLDERLVFLGITYPAVANEKWRPISHLIFRSLGGKGLHEDHNE